MLYIYVRKTDNFRKLATSDQDLLIENLKSKYKGKAFDSASFWFDEADKLDYHAIRRNCPYQLDNENAWTYIPKKMPIDGYKNKIEFVKDADAYWHDGERRIIAQFCCRKPR